VNVSDTLREKSKGAGRYATFAEFLTQVVIEERRMCGWVDDKFYELWPGGRCIDWTKVVS